MQDINHNSPGIVAKVWNIKASSNKGAAAGLGDSINYILNSEKTDITLAMENLPISDTNEQMRREVAYVVNDIKTLGGAYVGGVNIRDLAHAKEEMIEVNNFFHKGCDPKERIAQHMVISLPAEESMLSNSRRLMLLAEDVVKELFPDHQAIFSVHTNTDNLHTHIIINYTSLYGRKIHESYDWIKRVMQPCVNKYAKKYGFTPNVTWQEQEKLAVSRFVEIKIKLRGLIDLAIEHSDDITQFKKYMEENLNCKTNIGKHISLKTADMQKAMRTNQLGSNYSPEAIARRIQTRKDDFIVKMVNSYGYEGEQKDTVSFTPNKMKDYKDMTRAEKKEVIKLLRMNRNPWREYQEETWQLQKIVDNINKGNRAKDLIRFYAPNDSVVDAQLAIIEYKKRIAQEKKEAKANLRAYKPIIDIFKEMQLYEVRAYLFEHQNCVQYKDDFDRYKELTVRLRDGYNKNVNEVSEFIEEQNNHIYYATAQIYELSSHYKTITAYAKEANIKYYKGEKLGVYEAMEQWDIIHDAKEHHTYRNDLFYLVSRNNYGEYILIQTSFKTVDDKIVEIIEASLMDKNGKVIEKRNTYEDGIKSFNEWTFSLSDRGFDDCIKVKSPSEVKSHLNRSQNEEESSKRRRSYNRR